MLISKFYKAGIPLFVHSVIERKTVFLLEAIHLSQCFHHTTLLYTLNKLKYLQRTFEIATSFSSREDMCEQPFISKDTLRELFVETFIR